MRNNMLVDMARELLEIHKDLPYRFNYKDSKDLVYIEDFELYTFNQTWGSTAGGFGGIGGQMMTTIRTYVFVPSFCTSKQNVFVYFGGRFAYEIEYDEKDNRNNLLIWEDIKAQNMAPVAGQHKYKRKDSE